MIKSRLIVVSLDEENNESYHRKNYIEGEVLSPLLWSLVFDDLLRMLNESDFPTQGSADDIIALNINQTWSARERFVVKPSKTVLVSFTERGKFELKAPTLNRTHLIFCNKVKYLGSIIIQKLTLKSYAVV